MVRASHSSHRIIEGAFPKGECKQKLESPKIQNSKRAVMLEVAC